MALFAFSIKNIVCLYVTMPDESVNTVDWTDSEVWTKAKAGQTDINNKEKAKGLAKLLSWLPTGPKTHSQIQFVMLISPHQQLLHSHQKVFVFWPQQLEQNAQSNLIVKTLN